MSEMTNLIVYCAEVDEKGKVKIYVFSNAKRSRCVVGD